MIKGIIINHKTKFIPELKKFFSNLKVEVDIISYENFKEELIEPYDLIILSGGPINISGKNDLFEEKKFLKTTNKPILGICLGFQIISIIYGAKLKKLSKKIYGPENIKIWGSDFEVFQSHTYYIDSISNEFRVLSKNGKIIEIIEHKNKPIFALQSHPELSGKEGLKITKYFIDKYFN